MEKRSFRMKKIQKGIFMALAFIMPSYISIAQETTLHGYVSTGFNYDIDQDNLSFGIGNQSTVVTSNLSDRVSFLGESIFVFVGNNSPTQFSVYLDRIQVRYNYWGNHDVLIGKFHTPINYWNCLNSCHAMLFYPTISRPKIFTSKLLPVHETGISFRGEYLTDLNFGYDITIGNGLGASFVADNDKTKSLLISGHVNPIQGLRVGTSYYMDRVAIGVNSPAGALQYPIDYGVISGTFAYFKDDIEFLSEVALTKAKEDVDGGSEESTFGYFGYVAYKFGNLIPYVKYDNINFEAKDVYFNNADQHAVAVGIRYEINYMARVKLEYVMDNFELKGVEQTNKIFFQVAVGF